MSGPLNLSPDRVRAIRRDYAERTGDGRYRYPVQAVAARYGISVSTVTTIAKRWGLRRYQGNR